MTRRTRALAPVRPDADILAELCLPAIGDATPVILARIDAALAGSPASQTRDTIRIVLAEALNNISEHAYRGMRLGAVAVRVELSRSGLIATLTDWGRGFPDGVVPDGAAPDPEALCEGGYGWFMIRAMASAVEYERIAGRNRLRLILES